MIVEYLNSTDESADLLTATLTETLSQHLRKEVSALGELLDSVRILNHSLRQQGGQELSQSLEREAQAVQTAWEIQHVRDEIRVLIASEMGIPPVDLTLTLLAENTSGPLHDQVVNSREKLIEMSAEINKLNRQNAAMIHQSLSLIRGIVGRLTNTAGVGESYNAGGAKVDAHVGSLVEWGG